jgi:hypothetical protein
VKQHTPELVARDSTSVTFRTGGLASRRVFQFDLPACKAADGSPLQNTLAFYTVNAVPN